MEKKFIKAMRNRVRFNFRGQMSVEDLWALSEADLNKIYQTLEKEKDKTSSTGLIKTETNEQKELDDKMDIVEYIFGVKRDERLEESKKSERKAKKEELLSILKSKEDAEIQGKSADEIRAMIAEL